MLTAQELADLVMQMKVPMPIYDKAERIKWRIAKAIGMDRIQIYAALTEINTNKETNKIEGKYERK